MAKSSLVLCLLLMLTSLNLLVGAEPGGTRQPKTPPPVPPMAFPADAALLDVHTFGAKGDGVTDDTAAITKAIQANLGTNRYIYFPKGVYLVSDVLRWWKPDQRWLDASGAERQGGFGCWLTFQGQGPGHSIIRLKNSAPGYQDPTKPKAVVFTASMLGPPERAGNGKDYEGRGEGNQAFGNYIFDLAIDIGAGNPGAIALDFLGSNWAGVRNVVLRTSDPQRAGFCGLDMTRAENGPSVIRGVTVEGFDFGVRTAHMTYNTIFCQLQLRGQRKVGFDTESHVLSIDGFQSENSVPALRSTNATGHIVLIDGRFTAGDPSEAAIENRGALYVRNVEATGYKQVLAGVTSTRIEEWCTPAPIQSFPGPLWSMRLPIKDTPNFHEQDLTRWTRSATNAGALQQALNKSQGTVYLAGGRLSSDQPIIVGPNVRRIAGFRTEGNFGNNGGFQIEGDSPDPLIIDAINGMAIEHIGKRTVVFRNGSLERYRARPGAGNVFMEDACGANLSVVKDQNVWLRGWNPERMEGGKPCVINLGANLWILGVKTDAPATIIDAIGGRTELLGGLLYPVGDVPDGLPIVRLKDAEASLSFAESAWRVASSHRVIVEETRGTETKLLTRDQVSHRGFGAQIALFCAHSGKVLKDDSVVVAEKPTAPVKPPPPQRRVPLPEEIKAWDQRLQKSIRKQVADRRSLTFTAQLFKSKVSIWDIDSAGDLEVSQGDSHVTLAWKLLSTTERCELATSIRRKEDSESNLIAGFYLYLTGNVNEAENILIWVTDAKANDALRAFFAPKVETPAPASEAAATKP